MRLETWIPLVVALATAGIGFLVWLFQKQREHEDQIRQRKQALYESVLYALAELPANNAAPLFVESQLAWLYASDNVLRQTQALFDSLIAKEPYSVRIKLQGNLLLEMRRDIFTRTNISENWVKENYDPGNPPPEDIVKYIERKTSKSK